MDYSKGDLMAAKRYQDLGRFHLPSGFRGKGRLFVQFWWLIQSTLFGCSPQFMYRWRAFLLKLFGASIGCDVLIRPSARVTYPWKVSIGDRSWIGDDVTIYSLSEIKIGSDVVISQRSYICSATHDHLSLSFDMIGKSVTIEDEVWVATDVYVAPGITICKGAVVGARSSVFHNIPEGTVSIGSPAKVIKPRKVNG
jgi:putative colanic acid biosynthesis acetyltransferase WcaF